jgi:hypothetical protein
MIETYTWIIYERYQQAFLKARTSNSYGGRCNLRAGINRCEIAFLIQANVLVIVITHTHTHIHRCEIAFLIQAHVLETHTHIHAYIHTYLQTCILQTHLTHIDTHMHSYVHTHTHTHAHIHRCSLLYENTCPGQVNSIEDCEPLCRWVRSNTRAFNIVLK